MKINNSRLGRRSGAGPAPKSVSRKTAPDGLGSIFDPGGREKKITSPRFFWHLEKFRLAHFAPMFVALCEAPGRQRQSSVLPWLACAPFVRVRVRPVVVVVVFSYIILCAAAEPAMDDDFYVSFAMCLLYLARFSLCLFACWWRSERQSFSIFFTSAGRFVGIESDCFDSIRQSPWFWCRVVLSCRSKLGYVALLFYLWLGSGCYDILL